MTIRIGIISAAAVAAGMWLAPLALAARHFTPTRSDAFMEKAIQGNLAEIEEGRLAQRKGATAAVRRFGEVLVHDHTEANQKAMAAASGMGVTPPAQPNSRQTLEYEHLASLSGSRFDQAFVKSEIKDHRKTIAAYRQQAKAPNSPAATYASASLPVLHKHLRLAEALARQPGG